jgi:hypothetical protein
MKILAFSGKRKAGKTLAANFAMMLLADMGIDAKKRSFLFHARQLYSKAYGIVIPDDFPNDQQLVNLYSYIGFLRKRNPKILTDMLFKDCVGKNFIIIDDVKTIEDVEAIIKAGGILYNVDAAQGTREFRGFNFTRGVDDSIMETEISDLGSDTFRVLGGGALYNNQTQQDLRAEVDWIVRKHFGGG